MIDAHRTSIVVGLQTWASVHFPFVNLQRYGSKHISLVKHLTGVFHTEFIQSMPMCRYEDDRDEGEWFLYTGSGGRDLSGNKRVNNVGQTA